MSTVTSNFPPASRRGKCHGRKLTFQEFSAGHQAVATGNKLSPMVGHYAVAVVTHARRMKPQSEGRFRMRITDNVVRPMMGLERIERLASLSRDYH